MTEESIELDGDVETTAASIPLDEKKKYPHLAEN